MKALITFFVQPIVDFCFIVTGRVVFGENIHYIVEACVVSVYNRRKGSLGVCYLVIALIILP